MESSRLAVSGPLTDPSVAPPDGGRAAQPLRPGVANIPFWRRFHVRMSTLFGGVVFLIVTLMAISFYHLQVESQVKALKAVLLTEVRALSYRIRPQTVLALNVAQDRTRPEYAELVSLFGSVASDQKQVVSIYIFRPTNRPNTLAFAADYVAPGRAEPATVGEEYDARQAPTIMTGFTAPHVEDKFTTDKWGTVLSGYAPIRDVDGKAVAIVGIDVDEGDIASLKFDVLKLTLIFFFISSLCIGATAFVVGRSVRNPLGLITNATTEIASGKLGTRVAIERNDEFGVLGRHLDQMAAGLGDREFIRATFGRFVSEEVARQVLSTRDGGALGGEERIVTIVFTDLAGYSNLSEKMSPADVVNMLNTYFGLMGEIIEEHHGCVIEFVGDAMFCVFGAPNVLPNHAELGVRCALAMQAKLAAVHAEWEHTEPKLWYGQGSARLRMRIGIHSGIVIAGNVGNASRTKYSIIGDTVNVAARVEQLNKELGTETLITEETLFRLPDAQRRAAVPRGEHKVKGRDRAVVVYSV
jgi:class 3 adenylate cyclase